VADRWEKAMSYKTHVYGGRESSGSIVPTKRSNAGLGGAKEIIAQSTPAPDTVPDEWANTWLGDAPRGVCHGASLQGGNRVR
jgi:hypothetical protein